MKIIETNTGKSIKFGELIKRLQAVNMNIVNHRWINFKLLSGEIVEVDGNKYKKEIN